MSEQAAQVAARQPEEGIEPDDLDTRMIVAIGLISTALLVASVLGVTALVDQFQAVEVADKVYNRPADQSYGDGAAVLATQRDKLAEYDSSRADEGVYAIPLERAKELVLKELLAERGDADAE